MMIQLLQAAPAAAEGKGMGGFGPTMIIVLVALCAIMYFFMLRPMHKKQWERKTFGTRLSVG